MIKVKPEKINRGYAALCPVCGSPVFYAQGDWRISCPHVWIFEFDHMYFKETDAKPSDLGRLSVPGAPEPEVRRIDIFCVRGHRFMASDLPDTLLEAVPGNFYFARPEDAGLINSPSLTMREAIRLGLEEIGRTDLADFINSWLNWAEEDQLSQVELENLEKLNRLGRGRRGLRLVYNFIQITPGQPEEMGLVEVREEVREKIIKKEA